MDFDTIHSSVEAIEDYAEEYLFRRLPPADLAGYEEHLLVCEECRRAVEQSEEFIRQLRRVSEEGPV
jgi:predicted anti-sigma-YlaC factor YlaD